MNINNYNNCDYSTNKHFHVNNEIRLFTDLPVKTFYF